MHNDDVSSCFSFSSDNLATIIKDDNSQNDNEFIISIFTTPLSGLSRDQHSRLLKIMLKMEKDGNYKQEMIKSLTVADVMYLPGTVSDLFVTHTERKEVNKNTKFNPNCLKSTIAGDCNCVVIRIENGVMKIQSPQDKADCLIVITDRPDLSFSDSEYNTIQNVGQGTSTIYLFLHQNENFIEKRLPERLKNISVKVNVKYPGIGYGWIFILFLLFLVILIMVLFAWGYSNEDF